MQNGMQENHRLRTCVTRQCNPARWVCFCMALAFLAVWPHLASAQSEDVLLGQVDTVRIADKTRDFTEPSGIALASDGRHYWVVSDNADVVFLMTEKGKLKPSQSLRVGVDGLEGITGDESANRLLTVRENTSTVVQISLDDGAVSMFPLADMAGFSEIAKAFGPLRTNNGLEGITFNADRGEVLLVKESQPRLLLRLSADLTTILGAVEMTAEGGFSCPGTDDARLDASDILYDRERKVLWVLSDTGACILIADAVTGNVIGRPQGRSTGKPLKLLKNPEGVALSADGSTLRVVTDNGKDSRLMILSIE